MEPLHAPRHTPRQGRAHRAGRKPAPLRCVSSGAANRRASPHGNPLGRERPSGFFRARAARAEAPGHSVVHASTAYPLRLGCFGGVRESLFSSGFTADPLPTPETKTPPECESEGVCFLGRSGRPIFRGRKDQCGMCRPSSRPRRIGAHANDVGQRCPCTSFLAMSMGLRMEGGRKEVMTMGANCTREKLRLQDRSSFCEREKRRAIVRFAATDADAEPARPAQARDAAHSASSVASSSEAFVTCANSARKVARCTALIASAARVPPTPSSRSKQKHASATTTVR